jgi:hypothetical protein
MQHARVNRIELEDDVTGSGEPGLLINPSWRKFLPLVSQHALVVRYQLVM